MAIATQGTDGFVLVKSPSDPAVYEAMSLGCVTSIDPGTDTTDQIETTCLKKRTTREYIAGLTTPGQGSFTLNADPKEASHMVLFGLSKTKEIVGFAIGWSDGPDTAVPAVAQIGGIFNISVTNGGSGYTSAPTVAFTGGGGGTGAVASAEVAEKPEFILPTNRTWLTYEGYVAGFPFTFGQNAVVQSNVSLQRSGETYWYEKTSGA